MKLTIPKEGQDPYFKMKQRPCGRCGRRFFTTPLRRYNCRPCFDRDDRKGDFGTYRARIQA